MNVAIWAGPNARPTQRDVDTFNRQYPQLAAEHTTAFHDRFLILDRMEGCLVGASIKDAGKRAFGTTRIEDARIISGILARLEEAE